jgi:branched-chain amino acid transport system substrate-binding protein
LTPRKATTILRDGRKKMKRFPQTGLVAAIATFFLTSPISLAAASYDIDVVLPLTGSAAFVGQGERDALAALETYVDKNGGIRGRPLHFVFHDDQTSPQVAVQLTTDILGRGPAIVMGSSLVAMCLAMAPLMRNGPVHYCLSPGVHPKPGGYMFSTSASSTDQIAAVIRYYRMNGWTKLATLMTTDASGQDGDRSIDTVLAYPENKTVTRVIAEHFNPSDVSVAAQIARIKQSGAQAIIAWTTGAPAATVLRGMIEDGLDIPVAPTSGNQTFAAMHQWKSFLPKHLVLASALYPPHRGTLTLDPRVEKAQHEMYAVLKEQGLKADNMVATSWDAGLIAVAGLRKLGPDATAAALRDYIANLTDFPGIDGIYDFKTYPERGLGPDASTVTAYDPQTNDWIWLSKPGGAPLK